MGRGRRKPQADHGDQTWLGPGGETLLLSEYQPLLLQTPQHRSTVWHAQETLQFLLTLLSMPGEDL